ncbi:hypothetical protein H9651_10805 [Microbacterium sp. Sa4CUA7]|uniref:DUF4232 domain-containing protein n=1 Tax=Microbacterium pullorum TaxID=2762236 RepID=A0ABR8S421_9MICO|nr:hypothetical protein [Microbacterium pullorum]MBD7958129.1 hypothetical protein [Microbacterium pullorum]
MSEPVRRRPSPAVYRRRRLVLLLAVLLVIAGIVLLVWQPWNARAAETERTPTSVSTPTATPSGSPMPSPSADAPETDADAPVADAPDEAEAAGIAECERSAIEVTGVTDKTSYAAGEKPQLTISLANTGAVACTLNVGTTTQVFTISSGDDVWWRSTDCQTEPSDQTVTIDAGQSVTSVTPLVWDRTRSSVSTCGDTDRQTAPGGGSSFHLKVSIGGVDSSESTQFMLY